jgi:hypothetical protein
MAEYSFGKRLVPVRVGAVEGSYKTDGSALKSIHCIRRAVCHHVDAMLTLVNSIAWAPYDLGPILACASSDGKLSVLSFKGEYR